MYEEQSISIDFTKITSGKSVVDIYFNGQNDIE